MYHRCVKLFLGPSYHETSSCRMRLVLWVDCLQVPTIGHQWFNLFIRSGRDLKRICKFSLSKRLLSLCTQSYKGQSNSHCRRGRVCLPRVNRVMTNYLLLQRDEFSFENKKDPENDEEYSKSTTQVVGYQFVWSLKIYHTFHL